jgi:hypothetical protein
VVNRCQESQRLDLVPVQAGPDLALGGLEALFGAPVDARDPDELGEGGRFGVQQR